MTATETERLRELLDERGVEWGNCIGPFPQTAYNVGCVVWQVKELVAGLDVSTRYLTPEQAIEATLGRGTCHMRLVYEEEDEDGFIWPDHYECSECHAKVNGIWTNYDTEVAPKVCPNCGAKVVDE